MMNIGRIESLFVKVDRLNDEKMTLIRDNSPKSEAQEELISDRIYNLNEELDTCWRELEDLYND